MDLVKAIAGPPGNVVLDHKGHYVDSLLKGQLSQSDGLVAIARALHDVADAIRLHAHVMK